MRPTTDLLIAMHFLRRSLGGAASEWAVELLLQGYDTPHLSQLAATTASEDPHETERLFVKVLQELAIPIPCCEDPVLFYAQELARQYLAGGVQNDNCNGPAQATPSLSLQCGPILKELSMLGDEMERDKRYKLGPRYLEPFFYLYFAFYDLFELGLGSSHYLNVSVDNFNDELKAELRGLLNR